MNVLLFEYFQQHFDILFELNGFMIALFLKTIFENLFQD
jgi:hypothetical protein